MRKRNEGYTLPFVLVVMVVLCLVATSLMTLSLRNLQSQKALMDRMQDQYQAQGAIEVVEAQLERLETVAGSNLADALSTKVTEICNAVYASAGTSGSLTGGMVTEPAPAAEEPDFTHTFEIVSKYGSAEVKCRMQLEGDVETSGEDHTISNLKITYQSYTISNIGGGA